MKKCIPVSKPALIGNEKKYVTDCLDSGWISSKDGGLLIIQTPNLQAPDGQLHRYNDFTHEVGYIEHSLQQVLMVAGFKDIKFGGFEEFAIGVWKEKILKILRKFYWFYVKKVRLINGNLNPDILTPVFFAVVKK